MLLVFITLAWGSTFVLIKSALREITPMYFNAVRMALAAICLIALYGRHLPRISRSTLRAGSLVGAFLWLGYEFQTSGLKLTTPSKSAFITGFSVILVPVFLAVIWRRKINHWTALGVAAAFLGLFLLTVPAGGAASDLGDFRTVNLGDLLTLGCAIAFAFQIIFMGQAMKNHAFEQVAMLQAATCAVLMAITVPAIETPHAVWSREVIAAVVITAIVCTAIAFTVQAWAQQFTPPTHTALIFSLEPVFAWITSYFAVGERLGLRAGFGAVLILAGVLVSELKGSVAPPEAEAATAAAELPPGDL